MLKADDPKKLTGGLVKVGFDLLDVTGASTLKGLVDVVLQLRKPAPKNIDAKAALEWLIRRAAAESAVTVFRNFRHVSFTAGAIDPVEVAEQLQTAALPLPELSTKALAAPGHWAALPELERLFATWLDACQVPSAQRPPMIHAFADELPFALRGEWLHAVNARDYKALLDALGQTSPFDKAAEKADQWRDYRAKLAADIRQPLRSIAPDEIPRFSLEQLYVPLRAVWEEPAAEKEDANKWHLVDLHHSLADWITVADKGDTIRVLTGGPGSGKSSACRMLAADLARQGRKVLLAPLGRLEYHADAVSALRGWTQDTLGHDPMTKDALRDGEPLVLILDGLDELVKVGKIGENVVTSFVNELSLRIANLNEDGLRILLLLVGRPGAAEHAHRLARKPETWLEAQPFVVDRYGLEDPEELVDTDQRLEWWGKFGLNGLPKALQRDDRRLGDVSRQPLLNWLLAQVLTLRASDDIDSVHGLYETLLTEVLKRSHRDRQSEAIDALKDSQLAQLLEEVAVAAWHDGDRSVKLSTIRDRLTDQRHRIALDTLCDKNDGPAIAAVLDSFFCAPRDGAAEQRVFEFTHKSFREFLTVRRMLREVADMADYLTRGARYGIETPLRDWFALCGPTAMDYDLLTTLRDAVLAEDFATVDAWGGAMRALLHHTSHHGFPLPQKGDWNTRELDRQARNAEEALLAVHSSCAIAYSAKHPKRQAPALALSWNIEAGDDPGQWLNRLNDRRQTIALLCLNNCTIYFMRYFFANLRGANLGCANLRGANLGCANLGRANLERANLHGANLHGANLHSANLEGANLHSANLEGANLEGADLSSADLFGANLGGADLDGVRGLSDEELADLKRRAKPAKKPDAT